ncbi:MAG: NAD-dependent epimerase/dehydratase family protein [Daejeonella sp.]|uniref:polysaccharide biosynthesis C-terminal domain-containing protein n=1 Tax=Daejeonella sp. TaxID=2805397 RepID=UPI00273677B0|nr:NAD-dependent epimerase/dehydratase family protein [Daejeonella sp.]MDP3467510.1 NAD-dependent epimerase/dehydratase family protein [Daejeonella sp.]
MKLNVGITGQEGFVGQHLYNTLGLFPYEFEIVEYHSDFFKNPPQLTEFVGKCDIIVHLAAMNRHPDPEVLYKTNVELVEKLVEALEKSKSKAHVLFSSSSQEEQDNLYGKSKREGRQLLERWSKNAGGKFTGLLMPNIFGPFGKPYYNSFIATFCYQLTHNEQPEIMQDASVKLIYVSDLIKLILNEIRCGMGHELHHISHSDEYKVSEILSLLECFKNEYLVLGVIPKLNNSFELNLFNTFRSYIDFKTHYPVNYVKNSDARGSFVEVIRLNIGGQVSFSMTKPGITRGNHFHTRKIERFAVIKGKALVKLRRVGYEEILAFYLDGDEPAFLDMPIWYAHNIQNIGDDDLYMNFWINEFYDPNDPDTYSEAV